MTEKNFRPGGTMGVSRRTTPDGAERCYVRLAVIGDRGRSVPWRGLGWTEMLADVVGASHDVSICDVTARGATAYDVRRVQLREAVAHRPHLVALDAGRSDLGRRDWDLAQVRAHLWHCARVLADRGAVVVTAGPGSGGGRHRDRIAQLEGVYGELAHRLGTIHLDPRTRGAEVATDLVAALGTRGLGLRRDVR